MQYLRIRVFTFLLKVAWATSIGVPGGEMLGIMISSHLTRMLANMRVTQADIMRYVIKNGEQRGRAGEQETYLNIFLWKTLLPMFFTFYIHFSLFYAHSYPFTRFQVGCNLSVQVIGNDNRNNFAVLNWRPQHYNLTIIWLELRPWLLFNFFGCSLHHRFTNATSWINRC